MFPILMNPFMPQPEPQDPLGGSIGDLLGPPPEPPQPQQPELTPVAYRPEQLRGMDPRTAGFYKELDAKYPDDITLTSGYRSPEHNRRVGGAQGSQHLSGRAFDINVNPRFRTNELSQLTADARALAAKRGLPISGGYYGLNTRNGHAMHFDTRPGGGAMWGADRSRETAPGWLQASLTGDGAPPKLPQGPIARSDAGGARAAAEAPGPQQVTDDDVIRHRPEWADPTLEPPPIGGDGGGGRDPWEQYLAAARAADERERMEKAIGGIQGALGKLGGKPPSPPAAGSQRTGASQRGLTPDAIARMLMGDQVSPNLLAQMQRKALFA